MPPSQYPPENEIRISPGLSEDRGIAGTLSALRRLPLYARVLETMAHPDDENAATLVWLSRRLHVRTALFSFTRGEGGQNVFGNEKYEALGVLRTGEMLEACRYYGAELYFGSEIDFGFSKSPAETLEKWGRSEALEELVRFIRYWRPTVILSKWQGNLRDGHGHHQAAGLLTRQAFRAAGDPNAFPEHFRLGLTPWRAAKLYCHSFFPKGFSPEGDRDDWTVRIPIARQDPVFGRAYRDIGNEGRTMHRSQGIGNIFTLPLRSWEHFQLLDSTVDSRSRESGFFDSIDISLQAILAPAGDHAALEPLRSGLAAAARAAEEALDAFDPAAPAPSSAALARGISALEDVRTGLSHSALPPAPKSLLGIALAEKLADFRLALHRVLRISTAAGTETRSGAAGQRVGVTAYFSNNGSEPVTLDEVELRTPQGRSFGDSPGNLPRAIDPGGCVFRRFSVEIDENAAPTGPFWFPDEQDEYRYRTAPVKDVFAPWNGPEISALFHYRYKGIENVVAEPATFDGRDDRRCSGGIDFQIVPPVSISFQPGLLPAPFSEDARVRDLKIELLEFRGSEAAGNLKVTPPPGWNVFGDGKFHLLPGGKPYTALVRLEIPPGTPPGRYSVQAAAAIDGRAYHTGRRVVPWPGGRVRHLYSDARAEIRIMDLRIPGTLLVGYVAGADDEVAACLQRLGVALAPVSSEDLLSGDLGRFSAIVTGVRAYDVNEDLKKNNSQLLDYVKSGGVLIVQYNAPVRGSAWRRKRWPFPYGPYPMSLTSGDRITDEKAPLEILEPQSPVFRRPNRIVPADFDGWVHERGLYFMSRWDPRYLPLLAGADRGEEPQKGGMLLARYGKGWYVYSAYSWFRQLPAGVPGAYRIFVNLLSLGTEVD